MSEYARCESNPYENDSLFYQAIDNTEKVINELGEKNRQLYERASNFIQESTLAVSETISNLNVSAQSRTLS